jgi:hypothetical protein
MKWATAIQQVMKPSWTRREAAGLILLARSTFNVYEPQPNITLTNFDWYPYALAALGWEKPGDKFKVDTAFQLQPAPRFLYDQLRAALITMASELDDQNVPFKLVRDPRATVETFKQLAAEAWAAMKTLAAQHLQSQTLAHDVIDWPQAVAIAPAHVDTSPLAAAAKPKKQPEQMPLPGIQPVDAPITVAPEKKKNGSGGAWLLFLFAIAGTRKRRGRHA